MPWKRTPLFVLLLSVCAAPACGPGDSVPRADGRCGNNESYARLAAGLNGKWKGHAPRTPLGPRPYDMNYIRTGDTLRGVARPSQVRHSWTFARKENRLVLFFLSDFGGNTEPLRLSAIRCSRAEYEFAAKTPPVRVSVRIGKRKIVKEIRLRGRKHVLIRLRR